MQVVIKILVQENCHTLCAKLARFWAIVHHVANESLVSTVAFVLIPIAVMDCVHAICEFKGNNSKSVEK